MPYTRKRVHACVRGRTSRCHYRCSLAKVHPNASNADDERLRWRVGDDVVGEIDSFSRGRGKMKSFPATGRTRDDACSRRILVIIARRSLKRDLDRVTVTGRR